MTETKVPIPTNIRPKTTASPLANAKDEDSEDTIDSGGEATIDSSGSSDSSDGECIDYDYEHDPNEMNEDDDELDHIVDETNSDIDLFEEADNGMDIPQSYIHISNEEMVDTVETIEMDKWETTNKEPRPNVTFSSTLVGLHVLTPATYELISHVIYNEHDFGSITAETLTSCSSMIKDNLKIAHREARNLMQMVSMFIKQDRIDGTIDLNYKQLADSICFAIAVLTIRVMTGGSKTYEALVRRLVISIDTSNMVDEIAYKTFAKNILAELINADTQGYLKKELTGAYKGACSKYMKYQCHMIPNIYEHLMYELPFTYHAFPTRQTRRKNSIWTDPDCKKWLMRNCGVSVKLKKSSRPSLAFNKGAGKGGSAGRGSTSANANNEKTKQSSHQISAEDEGLEEDIASEAEDEGGGGDTASTSEEEVDISSRHYPSKSEGQDQDQESSVKAGNKGGEGDTASAREYQVDVASASSKQRNQQNQEQENSLKAAKKGGEEDAEKEKFKQFVKVTCIKDIYANDTVLIADGSTYDQKQGKVINVFAKRMKASVHLDGQEEYVRFNVLDLKVYDEFAK